MKRFLHPRDNKSGAALVIILAFAVLLTGLVIAFLSRAVTERQVSNSSASQTKADILAHSAMDLVVADLKQEIANGSTVSTASPTPSSGSIYIPTSGTYMKPVKDAAVAALSGSNAIPNLIRVSGTTSPSLPQVASALASNVLSTGTSQNGRSISPDRWNSHYLIPRLNSGTAAIDSTPINSFSSVTPAWVMITTQGPQVLASPTNTVVGRYAYAVYDESILLDMNVAGYPSSSSGSSIGAKGALAYADLTQIGVINSAGSGTYQVDNMVGWRNYADLKPAASQTMGNYNFSGTGAVATGTSYDSYVLSATTGFTATAGGTYNGRTDQIFAGRQSLIRFARAQNISQDALQYMGTFSRAVNAPSWCPPADAVTMGGSNGTGNVYAYKTNGETAPNPNRDIANVRFTTSGTATHYDDAGNATTYIVNPGDPLVQRRFSLAKLAWLTHNGANSPASAAAILACFGLTWDSTHYRWNYNNGSSTGIYTLDQVAALNPPREPDFFELLKAGILCGSIGQQPGSSGASVTATTGGPAGETFKYYSALTDRHIEQIGVNIIDQARADNFPSAVYQNPNDPSGWPSTETDFYNTVFGQKNLPAFSRMEVIAEHLPSNGGQNSTTSGTVTTTNPGFIGPEDVWVQPEVWNINNYASGTTTPASNTPSVLRIIAIGSATMNLYQGTTATTTAQPLTSSTTTGFSDDPFNPIPGSGGIVGFVNPTPTSAKPTPMYSNPVMPNYSTGAAGANNFIDTTGLSNASTNSYEGYNGDYTSGMMGIHLGQLAGRNDPVDFYHHIQITPALTDPLTFILQYYDGSRWLSYTSMSRITELQGPDSYDDHEVPGSRLWLINFALARPDPRTDRFSAFRGFANSSGQNYNWEWGGGDYNHPNGQSILSGTSLNSGTAQAGGGRGGLNYLLPSSANGFVYKPAGGLPKGTFPPSYLMDDWSDNQVRSSGTINFYYNDPDGIVRPGDAWRAYNIAASGTAITADGQMLYPSTVDVISTGTTYPRQRPIILNRPFKSVGELGYVYRDLPFKSLDFSSSASADAGLLDLFTTTDQPAVVAGQINPSGAAVPVLQAILSGAMKLERPTLAVSGTAEAAAAAQAINGYFVANGPITNPSGLTTLSGTVFSALNQVASATTDPNLYNNKNYVETYVRALAPVTNTRTWNLMIDVVAQSGHMAPNAGTLNNFVVEGERRYWLHVAIDRYTGQIVDQQLEPVYE